MSTEVTQSAAQTAVDGRPLDSAEIESKGVVGLAGTSLSSEALSFCHENDILVELGRAVDIARNCFSITGDPAVGLVHDRETPGESCLSIEIQVSGTVKENVAAHRRFAQEAAKLLGSKRELITLQYDALDTFMADPARRSTAAATLRPRYTAITGKR